MTKRMGLGGLGALVALLVLPGAAMAQGGGSGVDTVKGELDITWVMVACVLVLFMQAGFLLLEIGFSRQKNVGAGVAKVLVNLAVVTLAWWAVGFGISSLTGNKIFGTEGFFFHNGQDIAGVPVGRRRDSSDAVRDALLRGLAGDRLGHDARADQVRRVRDLCRGLRRDHLPAGRTRRLRRRPARRRWRQAGDGLRRFDRRSPHRRGRSARRSAAAWPAHRQVRC